MRRKITSGTENGGVLLVWTICGEPSDANIIVNIKILQLYFYVAQVQCYSVNYSVTYKIRGQVSV